MTHDVFESLVFAIHPTSRGYGYVLFESPLAPYDWGVKTLRGTDKNARILRFIERILDLYKPMVLVLEDWLDEAAHRCARIRELYRKIVELAGRRAIPVLVYSRAKISGAFAHLGAATRYDIAAEIAKRIPAFSYQLPPFREAWMSEDARQGLYDAAAIGLAHYSQKRAVIPTF